MVNLTDVSSSSNTNTTQIPTLKTLTGPITSVPLPPDALVPLLERCWCDFTLGLLGTGSTGFFSPFDVTAWEIGSLAKEQRRRARKAQKIAEEARLKEEREKAKEKEKELTENGNAITAPEDSVEGNDAEVETSNETVVGDEISKGPDPLETPGTLGAAFKLAGSIWVDFTLSLVPKPSKMFSASIRRRTFHKVPSTSAPASEPTSSSSTSSSTSDSPEGPSNPSEEVKRRDPPPLPPWTLDLRPHGMGLVIDFNWGRSRQS